MSTPNLYAWDGSQWVNTGPIVGPQGPVGPQGEQGPKGDAATLDIGTVDVVTPDSSPVVVNSGTTSAAVFDFDLPRAPTFSVGTVTTTAPGTSADVSDIGTAGDVVLNFSIPRGEQGIQGPQGDVGPQGPSGAPTGSIMMFGGVSAPSGWLICDGAAVSRTTFADLFSAIGTSFGSGNGSTTFNIPDMRLKFARGSGTGAAVGAGGGSDTHSHGSVSGSISINHSHNANFNGSGNTSSVPDHKHVTTQSGIQGTTSSTPVVLSSPSTTTGRSNVSPTSLVATSTHTHNAGSHSHSAGNIVTFRNDPDSGGHSHNVSVSGSGNTSNEGGTKNFSAAIPDVPSIPSYTTVNYIIKT